MGAGQSTPQPAAAVPPTPTPSAAASPSDAKAESAGMASFLPPPTVPGAQLVNQSASGSGGQSTSVLDSPTSCTGIFDQLWFCLCESWNRNRVESVYVGDWVGIWGCRSGPCVCVLDMVHGVCIY